MEYPSPKRVKLADGATSDQVTAQADDTTAGGNGKDKSAAEGIDHGTSGNDKTVPVRKNVKDSRTKGKGGRKVVEIVCRICDETETMEDKSQWMGCEHKGGRGRPKCAYWVHCQCLWKSMGLKLKPKASESSMVKQFMFYCPEHRD